MLVFLSLPLRLNVSVHRSVLISMTLTVKPTNTLKLHREDVCSGLCITFSLAPVFKQIMNSVYKTNHGRAAVTFTEYINAPLRKNLLICRLLFNLCLVLCGVMNGEACGRFRLCHLRVIPLDSIILLKSE